MMEHLPVEVIGNILSRLGAARDVVVASATCRKWREAFRRHLHSLSFNPDEWPDYHDFTTSRLEILITQTILQTTGLQSLTILMEEIDEFSASTVIAWLMYTRESLRKLHYNVRVMPSINILDIFGRQRLEMLSLSNNTITGVDPCYQRFYCLKSLSLTHVSISALDLNLLLTACPKIETLCLVNLDIAISDAQVTVELCSSTLKSIFVEGISLDKFALEGDSLESLHLKDSALEQFEFMGKGSLKDFKVDDVSIIHLDIGESFENLEVVDINNFTIVWPKFYQMISRSAKLRTLRLWDVMFDDEDEIVELEAIATCFPQLGRLSLSYDLKDGMLHYVLGGPYYVLNNVVLLEVGSTVLNASFSNWIEGLLKHCPNLKTLVIHGTVSDMKTHEDCQLLGNFTCSIVRIMRKYMQVAVQFDYE